MYNDTSRNELAVFTFYDDAIVWYTVIIFFFARVASSRPVQALINMTDDQFYCDH